MNLLNILLATSLITLILITILQVENVTEQMMIFLGLLILGLVISLILPKSLNNVNTLKSLNSKVYENNNNVILDNVNNVNNANNANNVNNVNNATNANNATNVNTNLNTNLNTVELNNLKKMLETDKKIYQQWKMHDENKINNFRELHNPHIPNTNSDDCVANLSCVIKEC